MLRACVSLILPKQRATTCFLHWGYIAQSGYGAVASPPSNYIVKVTKDEFCEVSVSKASIPAAI